MIDSERDLFVHELQNLYALERDLEEFQAELADDATDEDLESFFMAHSQATAEQLERLEEIFAGVDAEPDPRTVETFDGIRADREATMEDVTDPNLADLVDGETARAIERLEVTKLETLLTLSDRMDLDSAVVDRLERSRTEAENGLERLQERMTW